MQWLTRNMQTQQQRNMLSLDSFMNHLEGQSWSGKKNLTNWLLPKTHFWTFWGFSVWVWTKLALIYSRKHLQHESMPFFSRALRFTTFLIEHAQKSKFRESDLKSLGFSYFCFLPFLISFSYLFAAVITTLQKNSHLLASLDR